MLGSALKGLGVVIVVGGVVGALAGGVLYLFGETEGSSSSSAGTMSLSDGPVTTHSRDEASTGAALFGSSLVAVGIGLSVLVLGIFARSRIPVPVSPHAATASADFGAARVERAGAPGERAP